MTTKSFTQYTKLHINNMKIGVVSGVLNDNSITARNF